MQIFDKKTIEYLMKLFKGEIFTPDGNLDVEHEGSDPSHVRVKNDVGQLDLLVDNIGDRGLYDTTEYETGWLIKTDGLDTYLPKGDVKAANSIEAGVHISAVGDISSTGGSITAYGTVSAGDSILANKNIHIIFSTNTSQARGLFWKNTSNTTIASVIYHNTAQNIILNPIGSNNVYTDAVGNYSLFIGNNKLTYNTYPILHSNNYSSYALPLGGGTMTGDIVLNNTIAIKAKDTSNAELQLLYLSSSNNVAVGRGVATTGNGTYIYGGTAGVTFRTGGTAASNNGLVIDGNGLTVPNNKDLSVTGNATAASFIKSGGTASQFLKADGSVDSTAYLKQSDVGNIVGLFTGTCTSAADAQAKEATVGNTFSLVDGVTVAIKFTNSNTFSATSSNVITLNVNNTGAKRIWYGASSTTTGPSTSVFGYAGRYITYMYDATNDVWVWIAHGYDDNTQIRVYRQTSGYNNDYPILVSRTLASGIGTAGSNGTYTAVYGVIFNTDQPTVNPNTGKMKVKALAVNGVDITGNSDERMKDIQGDANISIEDIANAPSVLFKWKDNRDGDIHLGSIAQYWQKIAPWVVSEDNDGMLSLNYPALALAAGIQCAREVVDLRQEVAELKEQIAELRKLVNG